MSRQPLVAPLRAVHIQGFRGIRELTLELDPKVTVLFGINAVGKTSILDAISIGLGAIGSRVSKGYGRDFGKNGDIRVPWKDRPDIGEKRGVERPYARIEVACANGLRWDVTRFRSQQDRQSAPPSVGTKELFSLLDPLVRQVLDQGDAGFSDGSHGGGTAAGAGAANGTAGKAEAGNGLRDGLPAPIPLVAAYGTERAVVEVPFRERGFQREFRRLGGLDQSLRATTRFKTVFEWFRVMEDEERREQQRRKDFGFLLPELEWVRRAVNRAELHCKNPRVETRPIRMLVDFDHGNGHVEPLDISALSDGYRTHFALVVDVARRMVQLNPSDDLNDEIRGTNSEAVILIDEMDLHLDPTWQASVVRGLQAAFPNAQFILTTHSEQVIGSVQASSVRKLVSGDGEVLVEGVPFAQGATGERILVDLMGARERVAGPVTEQLRKYLDLVDQGRGGESEAAALRAELEGALPGDPQLHQAELEMQRRELIAGLGGHGA